MAARLVMRQPAGVVLRLNAANEQVTGVLERVDGGTVHLTGPARALPLSAITDAWLQRRSTGSGGKVGAIVGAAGGAALFGLGAVLVSGLCEYDCDDWGAGEIAVATLIGAAAGAASGYLIGALIGSSVPRWERLTETSAPATVVAPDPQRHAGLSALNVTPLATHAAVDGEGLGAGVGLSYLSQLSRHIAVGGELGFYDVNQAPFTYTYPCEPPGTVCTFSVERGGQWSASALARLGTGADRSVEPYGVLGLGVYDFGETTLGGYSAGAGLRFRPGGGRFAVSGEGRWHSNFTRSGDDSELGFYTFGVTLSLLR